MIDPLSISLSQPCPPPSEVYPTRKLLQPSHDHPDDYILELDYSSASKVIDCPRAGENYLIHSREAATDGSATSFGKLFHSCEEVRLLHGMSDATRQRQHELVASHFLRHFPAPGDHRTADRMLEVLGKYNSMYSTDGWPDKVHRLNGEKLVERSFKVGLCTIPMNATIPFTMEQLVTECSGNAAPLRIRSIHVLFTGRIDAIITDSNLLWVVDHKTSSRGGREFEEAFRLSLQTRGYVWAAQRLLGLPVAGLTMNAIIIRPPTRTGTGTEFSRQSYFYSPDSLLEWEDNMRAIVTTFVSHLVAGYFPQHPRSFKSPCAGCSYQDNCTLPRAQRFADLASDQFRDVTWSPINE